MLCPTLFDIFLENIMRDAFEDLEGSSGKREVRVSTLNAGAMTGRGRELADLMERRKMGQLCVQVTRGKGNKARELGADYKLFYSGADNSGRNWVSIVLSK